MHGYVKRKKHKRPCLQRPLLESVLLPLVEQIRLRLAKVHNFYAPVSIFFQLNTLLAVVSGRHARTPADDAPTLEAAVVALVADADLE